MSCAGVCVCFVVCVVCVVHANDEGDDSENGYLQCESCYIQMYDEVKNETAERWLGYRTVPPSSSSRHC